MDGEQYDDDGARRTKAFTTVKKMMMTMTMQERRLSWQFWHSLQRGLAFPTNAKRDLTCMYGFQVPVCPPHGAGEHDDE